MKPLDYRDVVNAGDVDVAEEAERKASRWTFSQKPAVDFWAAAEVFGRWWSWETEVRGTCRLSHFTSGESRKGEAETVFLSDNASAFRDEVCVCVSAAWDVRLLEKKGD